MIRNKARKFVLEFVQFVRSQDSNLKWSTQKRLLREFMKCATHKDGARVLNTYKAAFLNRKNDVGEAMSIATITERTIPRPTWTPSIEVTRSVNLEQTPLNDDPHVIADITARGLEHLAINGLSRDVDLEQPRWVQVGVTPTTLTVSDSVEPEIRPNEEPERPARPRNRGPHRTLEDFRRAQRENAERQALRVHLEAQARRSQIRNSYGPSPESPEGSEDDQ